VRRSFSKKKFNHLVRIISNAVGTNRATPQKKKKDGQKKRWGALTSIRILFSR